MQFSMTELQVSNDISHNLFFHRAFVISKPVSAAGAGTQCSQSEVKYENLFLKKELFVFI